MRKSLHQVLYSLLYLKYDKVYEVKTISIEKLRKFPFETYINGNGNDINFQSFGYFNFFFFSFFILIPNF